MCQTNTNQINLKNFTFFNKYIYVHVCVTTCDIYVRACVRERDGLQTEAQPKLASTRSPKRSPFLEGTFG